MILFRYGGQSGLGAAAVAKGGYRPEVVFR
jgi:hypothetical protein